MPAFQVFVRSLDGSTRCLQVPTGRLTGGDLRAQIHALEGISLEDLRLVTGTKNVDVATALEAGPDGVFPSITLLLRLRGGKGGFGSLLRGAATKAGQKKTSNFDACRDMSGRRLRHVNAEKKLKEWKAEAKERELEKTAQEYLKKLQKTKEEDTGVMEELKVMKARSERTRELVELAVKSGLEEAEKQLENRKRRKVEAAKGRAKRLRVWIAEGMDDDSDVEDGDIDADEEEDDEEQVEANLVDRASDQNVAGPSESGHEEQVAQGCDPNSSEDEQGGQYDVTSDREAVGELGPGTPDLQVNEIPSEVQGESPGPAAQNEAMATAPGNATVQDIATSEADTRDVTPTTPPSESPVDPILEKKSYSEPLDFDQFESSKELQALGLERLKSELQSRKLKCGGSLAERAARLFLLKTTPLEKLDRKHFIKAA